MVKTAMFGIACTAAVLAAAPAHADVHSFVAEVDAAGVHPWSTPGSEALIAAGIEECTMMRNGMTPEDIGRLYAITPGAEQVARLAQKHICPDTL